MTDLTPRPPIICTAPGVNPCGVLGREEIAAASAAGLCCRLWLDRHAGDVAHQAPRPVADRVPDVVADHDPDLSGLPADWPPFQPSDQDVPGGGWW